MRLLSWWVVLLLGVLVGGCGGGYDAAMAPSSGPGDARTMVDEELFAVSKSAAMPVQAELAQDDMAGGAEGAPEPPPNAADVTSSTVAVKRQRPLLIYTATYTLAVFEAAASLDAVFELVKARGGYLVKRGDRAMTVRVPREVYRDTLEEISKLGDVLHRNESVRDVTDEFMDIATRLKNSRVVRQRLEQLMASSKNVKEALAVERELARVTGDIERMEGKLKRLRELIAFSTITVHFDARPTERVGSEVTMPFPWLNRLGLSNLLNL